MAPRDFCAGPRTLYKNFLGALTHQYSALGGLFVCLPLICIIVCSIWFSMSPIGWVVVHYGTGPIITLSLTMFIVDILALVSIKKTMPNLLTVSKVYYSALGYWSLTNICILIVSGYGYYFSYLLPIAWFLVMFCILCLVTADLLRTFRTAQYDHMESLTAVTVV
jgi:hypothetical protein